MGKSILAIFLMLYCKEAFAFQLRDELKYCIDNERIDFVNSCIEEKKDSCLIKKNYLMTYINHANFYFKYGKCVSSPLHK